MSIKVFISNNPKAIACQILTLKQALIQENTKRQYTLVAHGKKQDKVFADLEALYKKIRGLFEVRAAKKAAKLYKAQTESQNALKAIK